MADAGFDRKDLKTRSLVLCLLGIAGIGHNGLQTRRRDQQPFPRIAAQVKHIGRLMDQDAFPRSKARPVQQPVGSIHLNPSMPI